MSKTFYIVDGHSQIFRAYYAPFRELTSPAGEPTRATYVFTVMLLGLIRQRRPDYLVVALDSPRESLDRSGLFPQYKATREAPPEDLIPQAERIEQIIRALGIPVWKGGGHEADDYIASAAAQLASPDIQVVMVSRDKDLDQALGAHVVMYDPMKDEMIDPEVLMATKGYGPDKAIEIQTLTGDSTDNIPGVRGIGPKTAAKLIARYGTAADVVAHADELTPKQRENVLAFADQMATTRRLVTLRTDVPLPDPLDACAFHGVEARGVLPIFTDLGFSRLVEQMQGAADPQPTPESSSDPTEAADTPVEPAGGPTTADDYPYHLVDTPQLLA